MQGFCDIDTSGGSAKWPSNLLGSHHWRDSRAHQAPFYARGLSEISAVSENAPGAHRDVPRIGGGSTDGSAGGRAYRWQRERGNRITYGTPVKLPAANRTDMNSHIFRIFVLTPAQAKRMDREGAYRKTHRTNDN